jgi:PilZ domain
MERRSQPRIEANATVLVTPIGSEHLQLSGTLENISDSGLMVALEAPIPVGESVRIDSGDSLMISEVCHCEQRGQRHMVGFIVGEWTNKGTLKTLLRSFDNLAVATG